MRHQAKKTSSQEKRGEESLSETSVGGDISGKSTRDGYGETIFMRTGLR